jgi:hypothetical protein
MTFYKFFWAIIILGLLACAFSIYEFRMKKERNRTWTIINDSVVKLGTDPPNVFYNVAGEGSATFTFGTKGFFIRPDAHGLIFHADTIHMVMGDTIISYSIVNPN